MRNDTAASRTGRFEPRAAERTRKVSASQEGPALVTVRKRLRQVALDLRRNRQDLAALARGLRTIEPALENGRSCPGGAAPSVEEWAADCADEVADGLDDLANLAETVAQADWNADVTDWIEASLRTVSAARSRE